MSDKAPSFHEPRLYQDKVLTEQEYARTAEHKLPEWVRCYRCRKPPEGLNWLKPINSSPSCRVFVHLGCISDGGDTLKAITGQGR
jgi:hypothetical protein